MKYAFIGAGKMASALIHGALRAKLCASASIAVSSRSRKSLQSVIDETSVRGVKDNAEACRFADVVVLCVKPYDVATALESAAGELKGKLLISIVSGVKISTLRAAAPGARVLRAMPNTAALVGMSATAVTLEAEKISRKDADAARKLFAAVGSVVSVTETQLDAVTGLSGSGPAFVYLMMEALSDGGVEAGLPRKLALDLAIQTVAGAAEMAAATGEHPAVLREMVTSPGGTTIAGLGVLEKAAVRSAFAGAVKAAARRAKELSGE